MENTFKTVHTIKDLIISIIVVLAGVGLLFVNVPLGIFVMVCGDLMLICYKSGIMKEGQSTLLKKKTLELNHECKKSIVDFLNGGNNAPCVKEGNEGGTVKLQVYYNDAEKLAYAQLSDYVDYGFKPVTEFVELKDKRYEQIMSKCNGK